MQDAHRGREWEMLKARQGVWMKVGAGKKREIKLKEDERLHLGLGVASKLQFTAARGN